VTPAAESRPVTRYLERVIDEQWRVDAQTTASGGHFPEDSDSK